MWVLDHKGGWAPKSWCFWTVVLEKTFENPLDCKEIKPVHPKGDQPWIFIGRTNTEAEVPIFQLTHWKRGWCWERLKVGGEGDKKDKMAGWHHEVNGPEFEQTPGVGEGQESLACCSPWGHKESDTTQWLNNNKELFSTSKTDPSECSTQGLVNWFLVFLFFFTTLRFSLNTGSPHGSLLFHLHYPPLCCYHLSPYRCCAVLSHSVMSDSLKPRGQ